MFPACSDAALPNIVPYDYCVSVKRLVALLILLVVPLLPAHAQTGGPDDQYVIIYSLMQQADASDSSDQPRQALAQYLEVQAELQKFNKIYPDWNPRIVNFRLNYLAEKIAQETEKLPVATNPPPDTRPRRRRRRARPRQRPWPICRRSSAPCMTRCKNCRRTTPRCNPSSTRRWGRNRRRWIRANWPGRRRKSGR